MTDISPGALRAAADQLRPNSGWWTRLMSGADNQTPAIGRVAGAILLVNFLLLIPEVVAGVLFAQHVVWATWREFLDTLEVYVPAMALAVGGLIRGTNATEPRP